MPSLLSAKHNLTKVPALVYLHCDERFPAVSWNNGLVIAAPLLTAKQIMFGLPILTLTSGICFVLKKILQYICLQYSSTRVFQFLWLKKGSFILELRTWKLFLKGTFFSSNSTSKFSYWIYVVTIKIQFLRLYIEYFCCKPLLLFCR